MKKVIQVFLIFAFSFCGSSLAAMDRVVDSSKRPHVHHTLPSGECLTSLNEEESPAAMGQSGGASLANSAGAMQAAETVSAGGGVNAGPYPPSSTTTLSSTSRAQVLDSVSPELPRAPSGPGPGAQISSAPVTAAQLARHNLRASGLDSIPSVPDEALSQSLAPSQAPVPAVAISSASSAFDSSGSSAAVGLDSVPGLAGERTLFSGKYSYSCDFIFCECCIDDPVMGRGLSDILLSQNNTSYPCCLCCDQPCCYRGQPKPSQRGGSISLKQDAMRRDG